MIKLSASILLISLISSSAFAGETWTKKLYTQFSQIDKKLPGNLGVYVRKIEDGSFVSYEAHRPWYLASTTKVPVAIALLKQVEEGKINLNQEIILKVSDYVDGSGDTNWKPPGSKLKLSLLLRKMIRQSDSTATDILIRTLEVDELNSYIKKQAPEFGLLTSILQVRYDAYAYLHPRAKELTNMDFIRFKKSSALRRHLAFAKKLKLKTSQLKEKNLMQAFEKYYQSGLNSAPLSSYGLLLEKLAKKELLNSNHTQLLTTHMENIKTGEKRIKAGLPKTYVFAQKTGTQVNRICNVGLLRKTHETYKIVVLACAEKFNSQGAAEKALAQVGQAISKAQLL